MFVVFAIPFGKQTSWQANQLARTAKCSAKFLRLISSLAFVAVIGKHSFIIGSAEALPILCVRYFR